MDTSAGVATWLSVLATTIGLGGLISQANAINEKLDSFHPYRNPEHLGIWFDRQRDHSWSTITKPPPRGPIITAGIRNRFCGENLLYVTRLPLSSLKDPGRASWVSLLETFHEKKPELVWPLSDDVEKGPSADGKPQLKLENTTVDPSWKRLEMVPLKQYQNSACITISRATFITFLCMTNARPAFQHSDAAGFRASYPSYGGQWHVNWPVGQEAMVKLMPHDSHQITTDFYPVSHVQRVDSCIRMQCGIIQLSDGHGKLAFCGRKPPGDYILKFDAKGFGGAHGSRHLYNMMGGDVPEVDFMFAEPVTRQDVSQSHIVLHLPSKDPQTQACMLLPDDSQNKVMMALDCLPWSSLSFSLHRGMRDILLAFGKSVMNKHRAKLAELVRETVEDVSKRSYLYRDGIGYDMRFVNGKMGSMAASAILKGGGDSADLVRVVTDVVRVFLGGHRYLHSGFEGLDIVNFWRRPESGDVDLRQDHQAVIALTKFFVLEWSIATDYQLYHQLPVTLNFG